MRRRFDVLCRLAGIDITSAKAIADVGCGHGILQRTMTMVSPGSHWLRLERGRVEQTVSRTSVVCCYDVFQKEPTYAGRFDLVLLFDVLEHIEDERRSFSSLRRRDAEPSGAPQWDDRRCLELLGISPDATTVRAEGLARDPVR